MAPVLQALKPDVGMISPRTRARMVARLRGEGIGDGRVLGVMESVPRHLFVAEALASRAYEPVSLPIGYGQTISQPFIVARMLEALLEDGIPRRVLEVGTGSGYHTALLAALGVEVFSIERIEALHHAARELLGRMGVTRVALRLGDGSQGWPEKAEFDAIVFTAAVPCALPPLYPQLRRGGRLLMPEDLGEGQRLRLYRWDGREAFGDDLGDCFFVPLLAGTVTQRNQKGA